MEGRGFPVDGAGGRPGSAPGELVLADLIRGERGGSRSAAEEGGEMGDPATGGADGPELPDLVVLEVGVDEDPQGRPWGPNVRVSGAVARASPEVVVETVSGGVMDSVPPCGGGRG